MNKIKFASAAMAAVLTFSAGASFIPQTANTSAIVASAAENNAFYAIVKVASLPMTQTPSPKSPVIAYLRKGTFVKVIRVYGTKTLISINNKTGYVNTNGLGLSYLM